MPPGTGTIVDFARLSDTIELAPVGIAHFDVAGRFLFTNPQVSTMFGLTQAELLQKRFAEISFPDDLPRCLALTAQLAAGEIPRYTVDKRFERSDGSWIYTRVIVSAVRKADGSVDYFLAIVEDLSEQWEIERARRAAEERLKLALEFSGTGIYCYDFRTERLEWANNLTRLFGIDDGRELESLERLLAAIHPDDVPGVQARYEKCLNEGADFDHVFRVVRADGTVRWIADRAKATLDAEGRTQYLTGACTDVTEREESFARERAARAVAERSSRLRDEMLAVVAHDLRNPVHTIVLSAAVLSATPPPPEDRRAKQVDVIRRAAKGMDLLIRDLLDVAQIQMGQLKITKSPVAIAPLVTDVTTSYAASAEDLGLHFAAEVHDGLPHVPCDHARIAQVLHNLIGNAFKFTDRSGSITVAAAAGDGVVEVSVRDTGRGIAEEDLPKIFDRYWQADRASRHGVGLGLAIVRGIVDAHGGTVVAESAVGKGSTFKFTLPLA